MFRRTFLTSALAGLPLLGAQADTGKATLSVRVREKAICRIQHREGETVAMRTISRRLFRLEENLAAQKNEQGLSLAELVRARRQRRLESSGEPFEVRPCEGLNDDLNRPLSIADILRSGRRRVAAPNERPPG